MTSLEKIYQLSPIFLQTIMLNGKALELYFERYGKKFDQLHDEFTKNQYLNKSDLEQYQVSRLKELVKHAYETVPYYKASFDRVKLKPTDITSLEDINRIPILTKEDIKKNFYQLVSNSSSKWKLRHGHTSGTTGTPLNLLYDINVCVAHHVADRRQKEWAGMKKEDAYASLQGRVICPINQDKPPFWRRNYINNQLFLSSFHLKKEHIPSYFEKLASDSIEFIEGYPSTLYTLASFLNSTNQYFPLKAVLTSSETLFDFQRADIERAFQCKIFDFYGMAERTVFATECSHHTGHHLNQDYGITEFLDDRGDPVEAGETGRIITTSLHNFGFPLIRYQTNDCCALKSKACECGRNFPLMDDVTTKDEAIITLPDGRWISPSVLTHPFKPMHNIIESQIIQEDLHNIRILIVKNDVYNKKDEETLLNSFYDRIGGDVNIVTEYVNSIDKTSTGKLKWVISKVKPKFQTG